MALIPTALGNTPGHYNHWSKRQFMDFVGRHADVVEVRHAAAVDYDLLPPALTVAPDHSPRASTRIRRSNSRFWPAEAR